MKSCPPDADARVRQDGFALLEVLVALAILALGLAVLLTVLSDGIGRAGHAERQVKALLHAQSLLAAVGSTIALKPGVTAGQLDGGLRWQVAIEAHADAADRKAWLVGAYKVSVEVAWTEVTRGMEG